MNDLVAGQIDLIVDQTSNSIAQVRAGNIRAYAVTDDKRVSSAADIPTVDEAGLPGFHMTLWSGLWVPKDTPRDIVAKLNAAAVDALNDPAVRKQLREPRPADAAQEPAHAGGARRLAEGRNCKVVADDQGRQCEGGLGQGHRAFSPDRPDRPGRINLIAIQTGPGRPAAGLSRLPCLIWTEVSNSNYPVRCRSEEFTMWLLFVFAWVCFLVLIAVVAQQGFGYDLGRLSAHFLELPLAQRWAAAFIVVMAIALIGTSIFLSLRMSRQGESLRMLRARLKSAREDMVVAHGLQNHFDGVVQHLVDSTPQEAIAALQQRLTETEQKVALQQSQDVATDIEEQLDDIRRRQQALRETVGEVAEKRRVTEPVFAEIKDRQRQLERSLAKLEVDDNNHNLADRLQEIGVEVLAIQKRLTVLQESLMTLNRFKDDLDKTGAELAPLQAQGSGIYAAIDELRPAYERLTKSDRGIRPQGRRTDQFARRSAVQEQGRYRTEGREPRRLLPYSGFAATGLRRTQGPPGPSGAFDRRRRDGRQRQKPRRSTARAE